jgi:HSP20 family molecular chaperone IbpA
MKFIIDENFRIPNDTNGIKSFFIFLDISNTLLFMFTVVTLFITLALCQVLAGPNIQYVQQIMDSIKKSGNGWESVKHLPPTLAEYLLTLISPKHKEKQLKSAYDFVVDLTHPTDIYDTLKAYPLSFPSGKEAYDSKIKQDYYRFIINVVGRYNVGKTYVLRLIANIDLGHTFTERTIGISVSLPLLTATNSVPLALIDTAGSRTPVEYDPKTFHKQSYEKQISDSFVQEVAFNSAGIFILVVNQLTLDDELYLKKLYKRLQDNGYSNEEIKQRLLILHNYFNLKTVAEVQKVEESELRKMFNAIKQPQGYWISEHFKHFVIACSNTQAGKHYNQQTVKQINTMIDGSAASKEKDVLKKILNETGSLLSKFLIEQSRTALSSKQDVETKDSPSGSVAAVIKPGRGQQHRIEITDKRQISVELKVEKLLLDGSNSFYFVSPEAPLSDTVILSKNLKFNEDGSVYIDYSSQFIPDMRISTINNAKDIIIKIECPSCCEKDYKLSRDGNTLNIKAEKIPDIRLTDYINTMRTGKFEVEIPLGKLFEGTVFQYSSMRHSIKDGVINISIPAEKKQEL